MAFFFHILLACKLLMGKKILSLAQTCAEDLGDKGTSKFFNLLETFSKNYIHGSSILPFLFQVITILCFWVTVDFYTSLGRLIKQQLREMGLPHIRYNSEELYLHVFFVCQTGCAQRCLFATCVSVHKSSPGHNVYNFTHPAITEHPEFPELCWASWCEPGHLCKVMKVSGLEKEMTLSLLEVFTVCTGE